MTRIVAGHAGGRTLRVPAKGTRPTSDRVRESLFNALESAGELDGARVLDLYAGSGALGLEALSRGAADALFVESDPAAAEVLRGNITDVGLGGRVRQGTVEGVLARPTGERFDLVLADPPYAVDPARLATALAALADGGWLSSRRPPVRRPPRRSAGALPVWTTATTRGTSTGPVTTVTAPPLRLARTFRVTVGGNGGLAMFRAATAHERPNAVPSRLARLQPRAWSRPKGATMHGDHGA